MVRPSGRFASVRSPKGSDPRPYRDIEKLAKELANNRWKKQ
jgi:hypothetical protein